MKCWMVLSFCKIWTWRSLRVWCWGLGMLLEWRLGVQAILFLMLCEIGKEVLLPWCGEKTWSVVLELSVSKRLTVSIFCYVSSPHYFVISFIVRVWPSFAFSIVVLPESSMSISLIGFVLIPFSFSFHPVWVVCKFIRIFTVSVQYREKHWWVYSFTIWPKVSAFCNIKLMQCACIASYVLSCTHAKNQSIFCSSSGIKPQCTICPQIFSICRYGYLY